MMNARMPMPADRHLGSRSMLKAVGLSACWARWALSSQAPRRRQGGGQERGRKRQVNEQGDERQQDAHACKAGKVSVACPHTPQQELLPGGEPTRSVCPSPNGARLPGKSQESDAKDGVGGLRLWPDIFGSRSAWRKYIRRMASGQESGPEDGRRVERADGSDRSSQKSEGDDYSDESSGPPGPPGSGSGEPRRPAAKAPLRCLPYCCGCTKQGEEVFHRARKEEQTFATRPLTQRWPDTLVGVCLVPAKARGQLRSTEGQLCGHITCEECTAPHQGNLMCPCCREEARARQTGNAVNAAGPLPKALTWPVRAAGPPPPRASSTSRPPEPKGPPPAKSRQLVTGTTQAGCSTPGCLRQARGSATTCCDVCEKSQGRVHNTPCDQRHALPPPFRRNGPENGDDQGPDQAGGRGPHNKAKRKRPSGGTPPWAVLKGRGVVLQPNKAAKRRRRCVSGISADSSLKASVDAAVRLEYAESTRSSVCARLRTWDRVLSLLVERKVVPPPRSPHHLTPQALKAVVGWLRLAGYRSSALYMSAAWLRHKQEFGYTPEMHDATRAAMRIATRGLGPAKGKLPVPFPPTEQDAGKELLVVGTWWLMRAIEIQEANLGDVQMVRRGGHYEAALHFPKSKADQAAAGVLLARNCICERQSDKAEHLWCPACTLTRVAVARVAELRAQRAPVSPEAPLFVDARGMRLSRADVVSIIEQRAEAVGDSLVDAQGDRRFGGHSMRVRGAMMAFKAGLTEEVVMDLGRWASVDAMRRYLRGLPLMKAAGATAVIASELKRGLDLAPGGGLGLQRDTVRLLDWTGSGPSSVPADERAACAPPDVGRILTIKNCLNGTLHRPLIWGKSAEDLVTQCGFKWAAIGVAGMFQEKEHRLCHRCFKAEN